MLLTIDSVQQSDLKAVPAGFLRVEDHSESRAGSQEGRFHLLGITPIHSSAFTAGSKKINHEMDIYGGCSVFGKQQQLLTTCSYNLTLYNLKLLMSVCCALIQILWEEDSNYTPAKQIQ